MAANNEYHLYIHLSELESGNSAMAGSSANSTADSTVDNSQDAGINQIKAKLGKVVAFSTAAALADRLICYEISQVSLRTGAVEYEQRQQAAYSIAKSVGGAGVALISGAITGGPAGFAVAAIGVAVSGVSKLITIAQKQQTLQTEENLENISIGMAAIRAGVSGRRANS